MSDRFFLLLLLVVGFLIFPAYDPANSYHYPLDGYYSLAGTFGELRPGHFHSGIDIKTNGKTGAKVYATQDGYVYRIKVSPYGYGKAIYLRHEDGRFSVYAHLSRFTSEVEAFVKEKQFQAEQFQQELYLEPSQFRFTKGQVIAFSGSSGTSYGPHLHFEIRDPAERIMNALPFFKGLIKDNIKPIIQKIAFEPIDPDSRINGKYEKLKLVPAGGKGSYRLDKPIRINGRIGLEYLAIDKLNGAPNRCGINYARLYLDDQLLFALELEKFSFDKTHHINQHIDYGHYQRTGQRFQKAYLDRGNELSAYQQMLKRGFIQLEDNMEHVFRLELSDAFGNMSEVKGTLIHEPQISTSFPKLPGQANTGYEFVMKRDQMIIHADRPSAAELEGISYLTAWGEKKSLSPTYGNNNRLTYLLPLEAHHYPQEIYGPKGNLIHTPNFQKEIRPGQNHVVTLGDFQAFFPYNASFQRIHLRLEQRKKKDSPWSATYHLGDSDIPLKEGFWVSFASSWPDSIKDAMVVAQHTKRGWRFVGNQPGENGRLYAKVDEFGKFCVMVDSTGPKLSPANFREGAKIPSSQYNLRLSLQDVFSGIASKEIYGTLDGKWVPFEYSYKSNWIRYAWDERPTPGKHILEVKVEDKAGNVSQKRFQLYF